MTPPPPRSTTAPADRGVDPGLVWHLLRSELRASSRWLAGLFVIVAVIDTLGLAEARRVGPVSAFVPLFANFALVTAATCGAVVALAFGRPTRARLWPFWLSLPVAPTALLAARLGFVVVVSGGLAGARVLACAALGAPAASPALTVAVLLRAVVFTVFVASLLTSLWLMPRALQLLGLGVLLAPVQLLPSGHDALRPSHLVREAAAVDDGPLPWPAIALAVAASAALVAACAPFFRRRLATRFAPRPLVRRFAPAWSVAAGVLIALPPAPWSTDGGRATVPPPSTTSAAVVSTSTWPELLPGPPPTATLARALDAVAPALRLLERAGQPVPRIVVARRDDLSVDATWLRDDVLVLSLGGAVRTETLVQRLVGEVVYRGAPDVELDVINPLAAVIGWAVDDAVPGASPPRRLEQIERRATCAELGAWSAFRAAYPRHATRMAAAFFADVADAGAGEPALVAMLRAARGGAADHRQVARAVPGLRDACAVPPSSRARVAVRPSWPLRLDARPLGALAATLVVAVDQRASSRPVVTATLPQLLRPGASTPVVDFAVDAARLQAGVPLGRAWARGSTIVVGIDADLDEGDAVVSMASSQEVTLR